MRKHIKDRKLIFFSSLSDNDKLKFVKHHLGWFMFIAEETRRLYDLTLRPSVSIIFAFFKGYGDIILDENMYPLSMLMVYDLFTKDIQDRVREVIKVKEDEVNFFGEKIKEIGLAYTRPEMRGQGFYGKLSRKVLGKDSEEMICLNSRNIKVMAASARSGLIPISYKEFPLSQILLSFMKDSYLLGGYKSIPNKIKWMSKDKIESLKMYLGSRFLIQSYTRRRIKNDDIEGFNPVWFVSMKQRDKFMKKRKGLYSLYVRADPHKTIIKLEDHLEDLLEKSKVYKKQKGKKDLGKEDLLKKVIKEINGDKGFEFLEEKYAREIFSTVKVFKDLDVPSRLEKEIKAFE